MHFVFFCEGQLGDLLILTPSIRAVKESFPSSRITTIILQRRRYDEQQPVGPIIGTAATDGTGCVMANNPNVDQVVGLDRHALRAMGGLRRIIAELKIIRYLRNLKPDAVVCTFPQDRFVIWGYLSGAKIRIGQKRQNFSWLLTQKPDIDKDNLNIRDYYLMLVAAAGVHAPNKNTEFFISDAAHDWATAQLSRQAISINTRLIAVHPGASGYYKVWPPDFFAALIDHLQQVMQHRVILCGTEFDQHIVTAIRRHLKTPVIEMKFGQNIEHFAAILMRCRLCISNDSGPRHLSVAVGTPSVAVMMHHEHRRWKIYDDPVMSTVLQGDEECPVCRRGVCENLIPGGYEYGSYCIRMITVAHVLKAINDMIER